MQMLTELNDNFAIDGVLEFVEGQGGLIAAVVKSEACTAEIYLHGAHLTAWSPAGHEPVLFLSERSAFAADKAIRGGVPVIFPWFGPRTGERTDGPVHGFARLTVWTVAFAAIAGEDLHLTLTLGPSDETRALGVDHFQVAYTLVLGRELRLRLTVANGASMPLTFQEALHTYLRVGDAEQVVIQGLGGTEYVDKMDGFARKRQSEDVLKLVGQTDRPYLNTEATVTLEDPALQRKIVVEKSNSLTTVVWNPWSDGCAKIADMMPEAWRTMTCVETANALENAITLGPQAVHVMECHVRVEELA